MQGMDKYKLTQEGRWKFKRMKADTGMADFDGYDTLGVLYEDGYSTIEEISYQTELPTREVAKNLSAFITRGLVEKVSSWWHLWGKNSEIQLP